MAFLYPKSDTACIFNKVLGRQTAFKTYYTQRKIN